MKEIYQGLIEDVNNTTMPFWIIPGMKKLEVNGLCVKDFGGPGMSNMEAGAILYEMAKFDASISTFFLVHNCLG